MLTSTPQTERSIPDGLELAFREGGEVMTPRGRGTSMRRRVCDLVLPTGVIGSGFPDQAFLNETNRVTTRCSPGQYPVFVNLSVSKGYAVDIAFVSVHFIPDADGDVDADTIQTWTSAGSFSTDCGDGCIYDASLARRLKWIYRWRRRCHFGECERQRMSIYEDGDGSLLLNKRSGANAVIFRTCDARYPCYVGRDARGEGLCFVVDGRLNDRSHRSHD